MAARSIWKGYLSFGLVNIPVAVFPAEQSQEEIHFHLVDRRNRAPVRYKRVNEETGEEVPWDEVVKGYEYEEDHFVLLDDADFEKANVKASQTMEIMNFVKLDSIAPAYFEKPYYVAPTKNGEKGYALLREALHRTGRAAIAKVVLRQRQHLAALMANGPVILMEMLRYNYEIREVKDLSLPPEDLAAAGVRPPEVEMAEKLIGGMQEPWKPEQYHDDYREDLMRVIREKAETGQVTVHEPGAPPEAKVVDMMALLKQSIEQTGKKAPEAKEEKKKKPAAATKKHEPRMRKTA